MRVLLIIIGYVLMYFFQVVLTMAIFLGALCLCGAVVEWFASIIPDWLILFIPVLLILAVLFGICGGKTRE